MTEISKTADTALRCLLEIRDSGPATPSALARRLGINRTVAHRLLNTLHGRGFVARRGSEFTLGSTLISLARQVEPTLRSIALPAMTALSAESGETVVLHIPDDADALVIEQVVGSSHVVRVQHPIGSRHPLYRGASGRAILAFLDERQVTVALREAPDPAMTRRELEQVREVGYAVSYDELQGGVHGVAVPVFDADGTVAGGLAIVTPATRQLAVPSRLQQLRVTAERLEAGLREAAAHGNGAAALAGTGDSR